MSPIQLTLCLLSLVGQLFGPSIGVTLPNPAIDSREVGARRRCEVITISFCKDIGYNKTVLPNLLNHQTQQAAGVALHKLSPLIKVNCSEDLKLLLCAAFLPPCTNLEIPIPPCRSICLTSKEGCEPVVQAFTYEWPDYLNCDNFPENQPCVSRTSGSSISSLPLYPPQEGPSIPGPTSRFACPVFYTTPKDSGYVLRLNGKNYHDCATPCDGLLFNKHDRKYISGSILIASVICLLSSLFTLFTHLLEPRRFSYPEKALKFLAICYLFISLVHIIGFIYGDEIACNEPFPPPKDNPDARMIKTITQGSSKGLCTLSFMFLYFSVHSSYVWFTIMTLTWFIAFCFGWGREGFERIASWFHVFAWAIPAFEVIRILALKRIEGDPLSGVCYHDFWNREGHRLFTDSGLYLFYIVLSVIFLFIGFYFSCRLHRELKADGRDTYKMDNLLLRVSIFSIFYLLSSSILIGFNYYETINLDSWMLNWQQNICTRPDSGVPCPFLSSDKPPKQPNLNLFILKYAARLVPGITLSLHLFSRKTLDSWLNFNRTIWTKICCLSEYTDNEKDIDE